MHDLDPMRAALQTEGDFQGETLQYDFEADGGMFGEVGDAESPISENDEIELASELLAVSEDAELDQFLGNVFKKIGGFVKKIARSPIGRAIGGALKGIAKKALPMVGGALGSFIPIPGVGTALGTALGGAASNLFEVPLEGETPEDQEFNLARRFVRLAGATAKTAASLPANMDPRAAAKTALTAAARRHAPGLLKWLQSFIAARPPIRGGMPGAGFGGGVSAVDSPLSQQDETDLAAELLAVSEDAELDQFLGSLFSRVGRAVGGFVSSPIGRSLGGVLKGVAKQGLPSLGGALGSFIPGIGSALGTSLGTAASNLFEVPLEGETPEDQEFDWARRFVRLAGSAAKSAIGLPPNIDPRAAAKAALSAAARRFAPGLLSLLGEVGAAPTAVRPGVAAMGPGMAAAGRPGHSGRWIRRGKRIILLGV
ncbi:MAG: hypothetical protein L0215_04130 [Gemmataceae bacterium]|nr:hypothetical protein [Gemmataceae bacterium]